jgi:starvation-inducible DNA-binding protein
MAHTNAAISAEHRQCLAEGLSRALADSYTLYLKTHNFHWNVEGPNFQGLHDMFEAQYQDLAQAVDDIAERIRALGHYAPGSYSDFAKLASVKEQTGRPGARDMVRELAEDQDTLAATLRKVVHTARDADDPATEDLMVQRLQTHEKTAWMLRSHLAE